MYEGSVPGSSSKFLISCRQSATSFQLRTPAAEMVEIHIGPKWLQKTATPSTEIPERALSFPSGPGDCTVSLRGAGAGTWSVSSSAHWFQMAPRQVKNFLVVSPNVLRKHCPGLVANQGLPSKSEKDCPTPAVTLCNASATPSPASRISSHVESTGWSGPRLYPAK